MAVTQAWYCPWGWTILPRIASDHIIIRWKEVFDGKKTLLSLSYSYFLSQISREFGRKKNKNLTAKSYLRQVEKNSLIPVTTAKYKESKKKTVKKVQLLFTCLSLGCLDRLSGPVTHSTQSWIREPTEPTSPGSQLRMSKQAPAWLLKPNALPNKESYPGPSHARSEKPCPQCFCLQLNHCNWFFPQALTAESALLPYQKERHGLQTLAGSLQNAGENEIVTLAVCFWFLVVFFFLTTKALKETWRNTSCS